MLLTNGYQVTVEMLLDIVVQSRRSGR